MNKFFDWISNNLDKICHFLTCALIVIIIGVIFAENLFGCSLLLSLAIGTSVSIIIGILKEIIDLIRYGNFDLKDILADVIGTIFGCVLSMFL